MNLDLILEAQPPGLKKCKIIQLIDSLDDPYRSKLYELLTSEMSSRQLAALMTKAGLSVSKTAAGDHRREVCSCQK